MKLGDCRGIVDAINGACTCGGGGPEEGCPACKVYHEIKNMVMYTPAELSMACDEAIEEARTK